MRMSRVRYVDVRMRFCIARLRRCCRRPTSARHIRLVRGRSCRPRSRAVPRLHGLRFRAPAPVSCSCWFAPGLGVASDDMSNSAAITRMIFIVRFLACECRSNVSAVSSLGKYHLSFGRRLCLPDQEAAEIRMGEYRRRAADGDLPTPTRVWSRFLPRREPALRSPLPELLPGQEAWIWSSTDSMSSSRTGAFDKETLVDVPIFPIIQESRVSKPIERDSGRACSRGVQLNGGCF
jgi:hypothetical protein